MGAVTGALPYILGAKIIHNIGQAVKNFYEDLNNGIYPDKKIRNFRVLLSWDSNNYFIENLNW